MDEFIYANGQKCCLIYCHSRSSKRKKISFFSFPKDPARRDLWIEKCNPKYLTTVNVKDQRICSLHFEEEMFTRNPKRSRLLPNATPTIFENNFLLKPISSIHISSAKYQNTNNDPPSDLQGSTPGKKELVCSVLGCQEKIKQNPKPQKVVIQSDHTYALTRLKSSMDERMSPEIILDPSTYMIQTLNVGEIINNKPTMLCLSIKNKDVSKNIENPYFKLTKRDENSIENPEKYWKEIAMAQSITLNDLRKEVKFLQQKIRRHTTRIVMLKILNEAKKLLVLQ